MCYVGLCLATARVGVVTAVRVERMLLGAEIRPTSELGDLGDFGYGEDTAGSNDEVSTYRQILSLEILLEGAAHLDDPLVSVLVPRLAVDLGSELTLQAPFSRNAL